MIIEQLPLIIAIAIYLFYFATIAYLIYEDREPSSSAFWVMTIVLWPVLGMIIFYFFGRDWRKGTRTSRREQKIVSEAIEKYMPQVYKRYSQFYTDYLKSVQGNWIINLIKMNSANDFCPVLPSESVEILASGETGFQSLKDDMRQSKKSIHMEFFIWEKDELTAELSEIMLERMKNGVEVRIKYDLLGSIAYGKSELKALKAAGAMVKADITEILRSNYRNHRKIAVIDGVIGYTGGVNIGQEYIDGGKHYPAWRDTFVRVTGPIVLELQKVFSSRWLLVSKENLFNKEYFPNIPIPKAGTPTQLNYSSSDYYWSVARNTYLSAIMNAKERIVIQSPYFIPDQSLYAALETAALSGVEVKLLMTGWPDKKSAWWAAQTFFERLLQAGMRVYYYEPGFMHAKTLLVDDCFTAIGSTNFDVRSFTLQKENALYFYDKDTAKKHYHILQEDFAKCREFTMEDYKSISKLKKLRNSISKLLSNLF